MTATGDGQALVAEERRVPIGGEEFLLHPLGVKSMAPLARIVMIAGERGKVTASDLFVTDAEGKAILSEAGQPEPNLEGIGKFLLAAAGYCEPEVFLLLSQLLNIEVAELQDSKRFPLSTVGELMVALVSSVDVTAFLPGGRLTNVGQEPETKAEAETEPEAKPSASPSDASLT